MHAARASRRRLLGAFSLVELIVSISIMAVLLSILAPALSAARLSALATISLSDMHSIAVPFDNYTSNNSGRYPIHDPAKGIPSTPGGPPLRWVGSVWASSYLWPTLIEDEAPWREYFKTWLSPGSRQRRSATPWITRNGNTTGTVIPVYRYSNSFLASPQVWETLQVKVTPASMKIGARANFEVAFPAKKALLFDAVVGYRRDRGVPMDRRGVLAVDGSAVIRKDSQARPAVQNRMIPSASPQRYHDTKLGVHGWDW